MSGPSTDEELMDKIGYIRHLQAYTKHTKNVTEIYTVTEAKV